LELPSASRWPSEPASEPGSPPRGLGYGVRSLPPEFEVKVDLSNAKKEDISVSFVQEEQEVKRFRHDETSADFTE
jgi:hypothetical protein